MGRDHRLSLDVQAAVLHPHVELFARHTWRSALKRDAVAVLEDVHRRCDPGELLRRLRPLARGNAGVRLTVASSVLRRS